MRYYEMDSIRVLLRGLASYEREGMNAESEGEAIYSVVFYKDIVNEGLFLVD